MTDDERLIHLLRRALPPVIGEGPSRDLWPSVLARDTPPSWSWIDLGIAAAVATTLLLVPEWFWLVAYHL